VDGEAAVEGELITTLDAEAPAAAAPEPSEMVVTGSRVKVKSAFAASAPVQVFDRKQLEQAGVTNLADVVQNLPIASGSGFQGQGAASRQGRIGVSGVDLRGLGFGATLVLVNGRRLPLSGGTAPGGGGSTADIGQIPMLAIERIEILKGGASAIYGSDAVAGVVNIITRKNWNGVRFEAEGTSDDSFDYHAYDIGGTFGVTSEHGRITGTLQWDQRSELRTNQRDWASKGQLWSPVGYPGTFLVGATPTPDPDCTRAGGRSRVLESPGSMGPVRQCAFNDRDYQVIFPAVQRGNAFLSAEYDLTKHTTAFIESNYSRMRGDAILWPFFVLPPYSVNVPANHVDNPFGQDVRYSGRVTDKPTQLGSDDDTFRLVAGLKGDLGGVAKDTFAEDWEWEAVTTWGASRYKATLADNLKSNLQNAINSCSDPSNLRDCFNPFYSSRLGTGTVNSDAVLQRIQGESMSTTDSGLRTYGAGINGSLFKLPGGSAGFALGGEMRHEWRHSEVDHDANLFDYGLRIGNTDYFAKRDVYGGYLELRWPVYAGIELQTAGRLDYYTDIDKSAANPTLGLTVIPSEIVGRDRIARILQRFQLRGHASSAFRAPEVLDASRNSVVIPTQMQIGQGLPSYIPVRTSGNPSLNHERSIAVSAGLVWTPIDELTLLGEFWHFQYKDRIGRQDPRQRIDGWLAEMASRGGAPVLDFPGVIVDPSTGSVSEIQVMQQNTRGTTRTNGIDFGATLNLSGKTFGGTVDDWGTLSVGAQGTYTLTYDLPRNAVLSAVIDQGIIECNGSSPTASCSVLGNRNSNNIAPPLPRLRVNLPVSWLYGGHALSFIARYLGPLADDSDAGRSGNFRGEIDAFFTMDLQYSYTFENWIGEATTLRVGVVNVADTDPPVVTTETTGYEPMLHDPRGRVVYAKLITKF
ncbi:MAG: TonB-dependent receptor, partial [Polyangiales bacterium]